MDSFDFVTMLCAYYNVSMKEPDGSPRVLIKAYTDYFKHFLKADQYQSAYWQIITSIKAEYLKPDMLPSLAAMKEALEPKPENLQIEAERKFYELMRRVHSYYDFWTDNPRLYAGLIAIGGWLTACQSQIDDQKFMRQAFCRAYVNCNPSAIVPQVERGMSTMPDRRVVCIDDKGGREQIEHTNVVSIVDRMAERMVLQ